MKNEGLREGLIEWVVFISNLKKNTRVKERFIRGKVNSEGFTEGLLVKGLQQNADKGPVCR